MKPTIFIVVFIALLLYTIGEQVSAQHQQQLLPLQLQQLEQTTINTNGLADLSYSRVAYVDMDPLVDTDDEEQENSNMDAAVDHIVKQGANTVFIQAYRDAEGYTRVFKMYFENTALGQFIPGRNHFVKLAKKFAAKGIAVGAWMPILAYQAETINGKPAEYILTRTSAGTVEKQSCTASAFYCNLTPFNIDNFNWVLNIYKDLLVAYPELYIINGHDDAAMNQDQDMSPSALAAYKSAGLPYTPETLHALDWDGPTMMQWSKFKAERISHFFGDLMIELKKIKPNLKSSRNFYVNAFYESGQGSIRWFSQSCESALATVDYLAPMVFPYMEKQTPSTTTTAPKKFNWYFEDVLPKLKQCTQDMSRWQICLQAVDWAQNPYEPIPDDEFVEWIKTAYNLGATHVGYYPSNHFSPSISPIVTSGNLKTQMTSLVTCSNSDQCSNQQNCQDSVCKAKTDTCLADTQCLTGQYCDHVFTNGCLAQCVDDNSCAQFQSSVCDTATKKCRVSDSADEEPSSATHGQSISLFLFIAIMGLVGHILPSGI